MYEAPVMIRLNMHSKRSTKSRCFFFTLYVAVLCSEVRCFQIGSINKSSVKQEKHHSLKARVSYVLFRQDCIGPFLPIAQRLSFTTPTMPSSVSSARVLPTSPENSSTLILPISTSGLGVSETSHTEASTVTPKTISNASGMARLSPLNTWRSTEPTRDLDGGKLGEMTGGVQNCGVPNQLPELPSGRSARRLAPSCTSTDTVGGPGSGTGGSRGIGHMESEIIGALPLRLPVLDLMPLHVEGLTAAAPAADSRFPETQGLPVGATSVFSAGDSRVEGDGNRESNGLKHPLECETVETLPRMSTLNTRSFAEEHNQDVSMEINLLSKVRGRKIGISVTGRIANFCF